MFLSTSLQSSGLQDFLKCLLPKLSATRTLRLCRSLCLRHLRDIALPPSLRYSVCLLYKTFSLSLHISEEPNYRGWIYGNEKDQYWIKNMYGTKYQFYNPLLQNYSHVKGLQSLFGFPSQYFIPIVVFTNAAKIKGNYPNHNVINVSELISTIEAYQNVVFTEDVLATAINKLTYSSFETSETSSLHKAQVTANITSWKKAIQRGQCPRCGGSLVYRVGRYGKFWGCSNYPKCHYTLKK